MEVPFKKLKTELPYDSAILFLGIHIEKTKTIIQKDTCTLMFIVALFTTVKASVQFSCSVVSDSLRPHGL